MRKFRLPVSGILIGLLNGLFGAGGGIIAVTAFQKMGMSDIPCDSCSGYAVFIGGQRFFILVSWTGVSTGYSPLSARRDRRCIIRRMAAA